MRRCTAWLSVPLAITASGCFSALVHDRASLLFKWRAVLCRVYVSFFLYLLPVMDTQHFGSCLQHHLMLTDWLPLRLSGSDFDPCGCLVRSSVPE